MSTAVRRALYNKLSNSSLVNILLNAGSVPAPGYAKPIYYGVAPDNAGFPYVLFAKQSGTPTGTFGDSSALDTGVWLVKGVNRAPSADTAESIAAQVDALLKDDSVVISTHLSGFTGLVYLRRDSDVDYGEVIEGVQYRHSGALYRLVWQ